MSEKRAGDGYLKAIQFGIVKANKVLPDGEKIPKFHPYQLRHAAITKASFENGRDAAQALAGHTSSNMTEIYDHSQLKKRERLARKTFLTGLADKTFSKMRSLVKLGCFVGPYRFGTKCNR